MNKDKGGSSRETDSVDIIIYVGKLVDIWKKNVLEDLKAGVLEYVIVGKFLVDLMLWQPLITMTNDCTRQ